MVGRVGDQAVVVSADALVGVGVPEEPGWQEGQRRHGSSAGSCSCRRCSGSSGGAAGLSTTGSVLRVGCDRDCKGGSDELKSDLHLGE